MHAICAWCPQYGRPPANLGERPPFERDEVTHGICPACRAQVDADVADALQHAAVSR